jgi:hypothetical protein
MKHILVLIALAGLSSFAAAAWADESVTCVQSYLAEAGYDVGKPDGAVGRRTRTAADTFSMVYAELGLPPFEGVTSAPEWCTVLTGAPAQAILKTRTIPPLNAPPETVGAKGGLNFSHELVRENYAGKRAFAGRGIFHGFAPSYWPGRVTVDVDPARVHSGSSSIRMHLLTGDCGKNDDTGPDAWDDCEHGNERVATNAEPHKAQTMYYALSLMIGANFFDLPGFNMPYHRSEVNLYQWYQLDVGACFNLLYNADLKSLVIDLRCSTGKYDDQWQRVVLPESSPDVWHEFVAQVKWSRGDDGYFKLLQNGRLVMVFEGPTLAPNGRAEIEEHPQLYAYGEGDRPAWSLYKTPMTAWFDDMLRSTEVSDIRAKYDFDPTAFDDTSGVIPVIDLMAGK